MQETESEEGYCKLQRIQEMTLMLMLRMNCITFSITALITLNPVVLDYQEGSNTVQDFGQFIRYCCSSRAIQCRQVMLLDNAKVHSAAVMREEYQALTAQYG
ncbi:hypothetical protein PROFUN_16872, partial [Planoprotostelium fungivorum]